MTAPAEPAGAPRARAPARGLVADAERLAALGTLGRAAARTPFVRGRRRERAARAPRRRRARSCSPSGGGRRGHARPRRRRHQAPDRARGGAAFAYRGAVPGGAPTSARTPRTMPPRCDAAPGTRPRHEPRHAADLDAATRRLAEAATAAARRLDAAIALEAGARRRLRRAVARLSEPGILQTAATILAGHCPAARAALRASSRRSEPLPAGTLSTAEPRRRGHGSCLEASGRWSSIIVLVIALIVLGPKRLPEVGRSVGKGMREFKDSISGMTARRRRR